MMLFIGIRFLKDIDGEFGPIEFYVFPCGKIFFRIEGDFPLSFICSVRVERIPMYPEKLVFPLRIFHLSIPCYRQKFLEERLASDIPDIEKDISFPIAIESDILLRSDCEKIRIDIDDLYFLFLESSKSDEVLS